VTRTRTSRIDESREKKRRWQTIERTNPRRRWSPRTCRQFQKFTQKPDDPEEYVIPEHRRRRKELSTNYITQITGNGAEPAFVDVA